MSVPSGGRRGSSTSKTRWAHAASLHGAVREPPAILEAPRAERGVALWLLISKWPSWYQPARHQNLLTISFLIFPCCVLCSTFWAAHMPG